MASKKQSAKQSTKPAAKKATEKPAAKRTTRKPAEKPAAKKPANKPESSRVRGADLKPIRRRNPEIAVLPPFDITRMNAYISITSPKSGLTKHFKAIVQPAGGFMPGSRIVYLFTGGDFQNPRCWRGFGWVDEFGIRVFKSCASHDGKPSQWERYAGMLERIEYFKTKGFKYLFMPIEQEESD